MAKPSGPLITRIGVPPRFPESAKLGAPAAKRVPRAFEVRIALPGGGHSDMSRRSTVSEAKVKLSNRSGVQLRQTARPPPGDQSPLIGTARLCTSPPGRAPLITARPANPSAPRADCTSASSGSARRDRPSLYSAMAIRAE